MERKGEATKHQLAESFKELMLKGSFDKITIRMITEQAGVIRPTFYNYFQDKYEVMEWLLEEEVFRPVFEMVEDGMERGSNLSVISENGERSAVLSESF